MKSTSPRFKENARAALANETLQSALDKMESGFVVNRAAAAARLPEFEALRDQGREIKNHTLAHLDFYLEAFETKVREESRHHNLPQQGQILSAS